MQDLLRRSGGRVGAGELEIDVPLRLREPVQHLGTHSIRQRRTREDPRRARTVITRCLRGNLDLGVVKVRLVPPHPQARTSQPPEGGEGWDLAEKEETACRTQADAELEGNHLGGLGGGVDHDVPQRCHRTNHNRADPKGDITAHLGSRGLVVPACSEFVPARDEILLPPNHLDPATTSIREVFPASSHHRQTVLRRDGVTRFAGRRRSKRLA